MYVICIDACDLQIWEAVLAKKTLMTTMQNIQA